MAVKNTGHLINFISGINGVAAGGQGQINMPCNNRTHRNVLQCAAVNYTGGTGLTTTKITGAGANNLTVTPTVVNGVITAIAVVAGGTGYVTGDTVTIANDATGTGFVGTVTASGGVVSAVAVTVGGTPSAINPATFFTSMKQTVNGVIIRDITPAQIQMICQANNLNTRLGELSLLYTEPWRQFLINNEATSWDLFGQATMQLQFGISGTVVNPTLTGFTDFDYARNTIPDGKGGKSFSLQPISQHSFTFNLAAGRNALNQLPINFPIGRMWIAGATAGAISQVEVYQDKQKVLEGTTEQIKEMYGDNNFQFGQPNFFNQNYSGTGTVNKALQAAFNPVTAFDAAYISDPTQRFWDALKCQNELLLVLTSSVAQACTVIVESLPGAYKA